MIAWLRNPISFAMLTAWVVCWILAWSLAPAGSGQFPELPQHTNHRPAFTLAKRLVGMPNQPLSFIVSDMAGRVDRSVPKLDAVVQTKTGVFVVVLENTAEGLKLAEDIIAAARIENTIRSESVGLLAPVAYRVMFEAHVHPIPATGLQMVGRETAIEAAASADFLRRPSVRATIEPWAVVHDALFFIVLCLWGLSGCAVPRWKQWRRLNLAKFREGRESPSPKRTTRTS